MLESIVTHNRPFRKFDTLGIPHVQSHIDVLLGAVEKVQSGLDSSSTVFEGDNNELLDYFLNGGEFNPFPLRLDVPSDYSNNPNLAELASDSLKIKSTVHPRKIRAILTTSFESETCSYLFTSKISPTTNGIFHQKSVF